MSLRFYRNLNISGDKMNNKGYILVEIILASALAMIVAYFVIELTIKLKNKNDDLLVKTLVSTDQAIMYNTIMSDVYNSENTVNCAYIDSKLDIDTDKNVFKYGEFTNVVSEYATIGDYTCVDNNSSIILNIPMEVKQLPDDNFDVEIGNLDEHINNIDLQCELKVEGTTIKLSNDVSNLSYYGWNSTYSGDNSTTKDISGVGTFTYYVKDKFGNTGSCSVDIAKINQSSYCPVNGSPPNGCYNASEVYTAQIIKHCYCGGSQSLSTYCDKGYAGCSYNGSSYNCHAGGTLVSGKCYRFYMASVDYWCASGYSKINNSYCYKLG